MKELFEEIHIDKQIDPDSLDVNWVEQSDLYYKYSEALNTALKQKNDLKLEVDRAKETIEQVKAELDLDVRRDPESYDIKKVTESVVQSAILLDERYQEAVEEFFAKRDEMNKAQDLSNKLYSCVAAMEQRKSALEQLVKLLNQQYFSTPEEPRNLSWEYKNKIEQNKKGAKEKIKNRRKKK